MVILVDSVHFTSPVAAITLNEFSDVYSTFSVMCFKNLNHICLSTIVSDLPSVSIEMITAMPIN